MRQFSGFIATVPLQRPSLPQGSPPRTPVRNASFNDSERHIYQPAGQFHSLKRTVVEAVCLSLSPVPRRHVHKVLFQVSIAIGAQSWDDSGKKRRERRQRKGCP